MEHDFLVQFSWPLDGLDSNEFSNLKITSSTHTFSRVSRKSKIHPVCAGTSSPGWPLENGNIFHEFMHIYIYLICFYKGIFLEAKVDQVIF